MKCKFFFLMVFALLILPRLGQSQNHKNGSAGYMTKDSIVRKGYTLIFVNRDSLFSKEIKQKMEETFFKVYPPMARRFNKKSNKKILFVIDPGYDGIAATSGGKVVFNPGWFKKNPGDIDVVTHEVMHIVQSYGRTNGPMWLTEGIADYVRFKFGVDHAGANWKLPEVKSNQKYTNSYRVTARFLAWLETHKDKRIVNKLDNVMREKKYSDGIWQEFTGKTIDELWAEYQGNPEL